MSSDMGGLMNKYALIENDTVINVIEADEAFIQNHTLHAVLETNKTGIAKIGAKFVDGKFDDADLFDDSGRQLAKEREAQAELEIQQKAEAVKALALKLNITEEEAKLLVS